MSDMKMSDFFILPVSDDAVVNIDYQQTVHENNDGVAPFDAATHAINNHDRMVEEISELREFVKMVSNGMSEDPEVALVHLGVHSREAKKLLNKND